MTLSPADAIIADLIAGLAGELGKHPEWRPDFGGGHLDTEAWAKKLVLDTLYHVRGDRYCPDCSTPLGSTHAPGCDWAPF